MQTLSSAQTLGTFSSNLAPNVRENGKSRENLNTETSSNLGSEIQGTVPNAVNPQDLESAKAEVKELYQNTSVENVAAAPKGGSASEFTPDQQRIRENAAVRNAMIRDKVEAQEAQVKAQRLAHHDEVFLSREASNREHVEAFALARDMIALQQQKDDANQRQINAEQVDLGAIRDLANRNRSMAIAKEANTVSVEKQQTQVTSRRLDNITPGTFESVDAQDVPSPPDVGIVPGLQTRHDIELNPGAVLPVKEANAQSLERLEAAEALDATTMSTSSSESGKQRPVELSNKITKLKENAARQGVYTLNSDAHAKDVAKEVRDETIRRPEAALTSQSQVSLQAALRVLE